MPSTMINRPGSLFSSTSTSSGIDRVAESGNTDAKGALSTSRWRLERPRVNDRRSQYNMAVAAFKRDCLRIGATVPHQSVGQRDTGSNLLDNRQVCRAEQRRIALDAGFTFADRIDGRGNQSERAM